MAAPAQAINDLLFFQISCIMAKVGAGPLASPLVSIFDVCSEDNSLSQPAADSSLEEGAIKGGTPMRVMAIDYGDAHTGVAVSDPTGFLTGSTTTINSWRQEIVVDRLARLIEEHRPEEVVLGFPRNMDGTDGKKAELYRQLAAALKEVTGKTVILWDERRTTIDAHRILFNQGKDGRKRKKIVDAVAASLILENYLDFRRMKQE